MSAAEGRDGDDDDEWGVNESSSAAVGLWDEQADLEDWADVCVAETDGELPPSLARAHGHGADEREFGTAHSSVAASLASTGAMPNLQLKLDEVWMAHVS